MEPLKSNPKRQAIQTLKGYSYQIWQSILHWIELQENQYLFLEGAEDIDLHSPDWAEVVQVKETAESGALTLRSPDIIEAINHFWEHQANNSSITIRFKFLTTAERGLEKPNPFGNIRGLDLWDSCKYPGSDCSLLKAFLLSAEKISPSLRNFMKAATDEELRQQLILPIEWNTGNKKQEFIEDIVNRKISEHGYKVAGLSPFESKKVIPELLKHVWNVARQKENRSLTLYDFLRIFEESTMQLVSKEKLRQLELLKAERTSFGRQSQVFSYAEDLGMGGILESFSAPDMSKLVARSELIERLRAKLNNKGVLVLTGSTGMGKSTLSNYVADTTEGNWRKIDLRGCEPSDIKNRLNFASRVIEDSSEPIDCIVDDLNFEKQSIVYENALSKLIFALKLKQGRIIITSQNSLPVLIRNQYDISEDSLISVPTLEEREIRELALKHGSPQDRRLNSWTKIVLAQTGGHPLLVHAHIRSLQYKEWPEPLPEDIFFNQEIKDVQQEFRRNLREQLPVDARALLYRLSILINRFKRRQVLFIGKRAQAIPMTGENFDLLIGPWIEPTGNDRFRLSPLLRNAAQEEFLPEEIKKWHSAAATSYLEERRLEFSDIDAILMHGILGNNPFAMIQIVPAILGVDVKYKRSLAERISWFGVLKTEENASFFPGFLTFNNLLRSLQFFILSETEPANALPVVRNWEREIRQDNEEIEISGIRTQTMFHFLSDVILEFRVPFSPTQIANWLLQLAELLKTTEKFFPDHPQEEVKFRNSIRDLDKIGVYVRASILRCQMSDEVIELLKALQESKSDYVDEVWKVLNEEPDLATSIANKIWLDETKNSSSADWSKCLENLDWIIKLAVQKQIESLVAASYECKAVIYEEYLNDTSTALQQLTDGENALGYAHNFLQYYRARIFLFKEQYAEALEILRKVLEEYELQNHSARFLVYRDASICAGRLGEWKEAAHFAQKGKESLEKPRANESVNVTPSKSDQVLARSFQAEYAYDLWRSGEQASSFREFVDISNFFQEFPALEENLQAHQLYKRIKYILGWMFSSIGWIYGQEVRNQLAPFVPAPGWVSDFNLEKGAKIESVQSKANTWGLLANLEYKLNLGNEVFQRFEQINQTSGTLATTGVLQYLRIQHTLKDFDFENLVSYWIGYILCTKADAGTPDRLDLNSQDEEFLKHLNFVAFLLLAGQKKIADLPLKKWRQDLSGRQMLTPNIKIWFQHIDEIIRADQAKLIKILNDWEESWERKQLAAIMLSAEEALDLDTRFSANVSLITTNFLSVWKEEVKDAIKILVVDKWGRAAERERFALLSPSITAPEILKVCEDTTVTGVAQAARVLMAAAKAVKIRISEQAFENLRSLAETDIAA